MKSDQPVLPFLCGAVLILLAVSVPLFASQDTPGVEEPLAGAEAADPVATELSSNRSADPAVRATSNALPLFGDDALHMNGEQLLALQMAPDDYPQSERSDAIAAMFEDEADLVDDSTESAARPTTVDSPSGGASDGRPKIGDTYFSIAVGSGITNIDESNHRDDKKQQFHSFDIRFGQYFAKNWRVDFLHVNEGHPYNHHRDGFAVQATYGVSLVNNYRFEFGTGPYLSFDTTVDDAGAELNEKRVGMLTTVAMILPLPVMSKNFHLRFQWSNYFMNDRPNGNSLLVSVGFDVDHALYPPREDYGDHSWEAWAAIANTKITHGGPETTTGFSVDVARRFAGTLAISLGYLYEGGYNGATDRQGLTLQIWKDISLGRFFEIAIGAGPYFAKDKVEDSDDYDIKGIITFGGNYYPPWNWCENWYLGVSLSRVIDRKNPEDDADVTRLSVGTRF
jgi:hypothetical protein